MSALAVFDRPWMLIVALLLAIVAAVLTLRLQRRRETRLARFGTASVVARLIPPGLRRRASRWRAVRLALATGLAGVALAGPRWGRERVQIRVQGYDLVLAVDASLSMHATDDRPNRLERVKQELRRLRAERPTGRAGLIAFAGRSYILTPMTVDEGAIELYLDNLDPSIVGQAGSSLARAIRQGTDLLSASQGDAGKALVVLSDGEAFEPIEDVTAAATRAREAGIVVVTVGFGTEQGATIPITTDDGRRALKTDESGQVVVSRYSPEFLRAAAEAAGGTFIPAAQTDKAARVLAALRSLRAADIAMQAAAQRTPRFHWFLAPALLLLLLDTWLAERRRRVRQAGPAAAVPAAAAILLLFVPLPARADDAGDAAKAYREGRYAEAAALYRRVVESGNRTPVMIYNLATALIAADSLGRATELLDRITAAQDPELRYRILFNLGLAHLRRGLALPADSATPSLDAALAAYKRVLLLRARDMDAKWNFELALRKKQGGGGGGGGGGEDQNDDPSPAAPRDPRPEPQPSGSLEQQRAEQILNSASRDEREVQARKQREGRPATPPGGKDW
jgi:Ca-activated chloride channel family protein